MHPPCPHNCARRWIGLVALVIFLSIRPGHTIDASNETAVAGLPAITNTISNTPPALSKESIRARALDELRRKAEVKRREQELQREQVNKVLQETAAEHAAVAKANLPPPPRTTIMDRHPQATLLALAAALCVVLTIQTLTRHQREAEIRALSGNYLADGTEVIRVEMPDFFALPKPVQPEAAPIVETKIRARDPVDVFLEEAPAQIDLFREHLAEFKKISEGEKASSQEQPSLPLDQEKQKCLSTLHHLIGAFVKKANLWPLRPIWQVSSAMELLVERVARKPVDATPSVMRTIAAAVEILPSLCTLDIRPDLIIAPPIKILAADDDALCRRAVGFALSKANLPCDFAEDGAKAAHMASQVAYDLILLDIQMPEMDGLAACAEIRNDRKNVTTPIIFVTVQSDFQTRVDSAVSGGTDFMAKPFLVFELTVKAVLAAVSKRLTAPEQGRALEDPRLQAAEGATPREPATLGDTLSAGAVADFRALSKPRHKPRPKSRDNRKRPAERQRSTMKSR